MAELPLASIERIIKKAGASRVSENAKAKLRDVLENKAFEISTKAKALAEHANRVTVTAEDIALAVKD